MRTRTVISQVHCFHWLGSFGNRGNGRYRTELRQGLAAITRSLAAYQLPQARARLWLDGKSGTGAVLADLAGFAFVTRGKEDSVLDHPLVQARLHPPPDQLKPHPESQVVRSLYDCAEIPVGSEGVLCRMVVATHPAGKKLSRLASNRLDARPANLIAESLENRSGSLVQWQEHRTSSEHALHRKKA